MFGMIAVVCWVMRAGWALTNHDHGRISVINFTTLCNDDERSDDDENLREKNCSRKDNVS
jgi:hypothetical protein